MLLPKSPDSPEQTQEPLPLGAGQGRFELAESAAEVIRTLAAQAPVCIVLDDLHAADPGALFVLRYLVRNLRDQPVLVVGTYRETEASLRPEISSALSEIGRDAAQVIAMPPLGRDETSEWLAENLQTPSTKLVEVVFQATQGNPLFLGELLAWMGAHGPADVLSATGLPVPRGVREVIQQRLAPLPEALRDVLRVAAVVGAEFNAAVVARVMKRNPVEIIELIEEAQSRGIVKARGHHLFAFSHGLVREVVYRDLPPGHRAGGQWPGCIALFPLRPTENRR
jgi:predicted ATPase